MTLRVLRLTPDNPCNCTLVDPSTDEIWYTVSTEHGKNTVTSVKDGNDQVIASWKWKDYSSDVVTLGSKEPMAASSWLKKSLVPFKTSVTFVGGKDDASYTWRNNVPMYELELYIEGDNNEPVAQFKKSAKWKDRTQDPPVDMSRPATLTLDLRGQEIQDLIVISFLMLEKKKRAKGQGWGFPSAHHGTATDALLSTAG
ncbi:hypothetical protein BKA70DRAFT_1185360 [Coprinopsis sp. MPI-PUGE-AT-0042]|nr:hypothetical protein BKA70DRAFT_1185360 [Coprinopsis sp. MPI-PUGE-AT-0042]